MSLGHSAQGGLCKGSGLGNPLDGDDVISAYKKYRQLKLVACQRHCQISYTVNHIVRSISDTVI